MIGNRLEEAQENRVKGVPEGAETREALRQGIDKFEHCLDVMFELEELLKAPRDEENAGAYVRVTAALPREMLGAKCLKLVFDRLSLKLLWAELVDEAH